MRNIRLTIAYDGTRYVGWQRQENGLAVQEVVEGAVEKLTLTRTGVTGAGRTDSGVHALAQVAHFHTESSIPCEKIRTGLQRFLPDDIIIRNVEDVAVGFHSRYHAIQKRYRYVINNVPVKSPFLDRFALHIRYPLDAAAMHAAAQVLCGTHDFCSFETNYPNRATSVRTVSEVTILRTSGWDSWTQETASAAAPTQESDFITLEIVADGFLYNMVRSIVGTLLRVGDGSWTTADVERIVKAHDRAQAGKTAAPHGLYLVQVDYGDVHSTVE